MAHVSTAFLTSISPTQLLTKSSNTHAHSQSCPLLGINWLIPQSVGLWDTYGLSRASFLTATGLLKGWEKIRYKMQWFVCCVMGMFIQWERQNFISISTLYQKITDFLDVQEKSNLWGTTITLHTVPQVSTSLSIDNQGIPQVDPGGLIEFPVGICLVVVSKKGDGFYNTWNAVLETPIVPTKR